VSSRSADQPNARIIDLHALALPSRYCTNCGARLEPGHRYCWSCGTQRWTPEPASPAPVRPAAAGPVSLGLLPWFYGAGAVFFLVWATQALAVFLSPVGRADLGTEMARQGVPAAMRARC